MRGRHKIFSDDQIREAIAYHDEGHTWRQAAERLGISEPRLHNRASTLLGRPYPSSLYRTIGQHRVSDYEVEKMRAAQDGKCGICGKAPARLVVDHCYKSGKIRGLLCLPCNAALGWVEKGGKTGWLKQALTYIRHPPGRARDHADATQEADR